MRWYNHDHRHSGISFVTPAQRHNGEDRAILKQRQAVYATARAENPARLRQKHPELVLAGGSPFKSR